MVRVKTDEEGFLIEPCKSCDKAYVDDLFYEWDCDEKVCPHKMADMTESEVGK